MVRRRQIGRLALAAVGSALAGEATLAQQPVDALTKFDEDLAAVKNNPQLVENAHTISEDEFRLRGPTPDEFALQPHLPRTFMSEKPISARARSLMITFEVSGKDLYEQRYLHPILPGVKSGLTIGFGYDLGYVKPEDFEADWAPFIPASVIARLKPACGHPGASDLTAPANYADVIVPWNAAEEQFDIAIKQTAGQTEHVFPGSSDLSPDSFGALVDLVYNRGGALKRDPTDPQDRRREMRTIRQLMLTDKLKDVPDQLISMKRLWVGDPNATGLLRRRDIEAELFRAGLST